MVVAAQEGDENNHGELLHSGARDGYEEHDVAHHRGYLDLLRANFLTTKITDISWREIS